MAETENELLTEGTDNEVFKEASSDVPAKEPEIEAAIDDPGKPDAGRPRDETGKFVAKPKEEQAETEQPEVKAEPQKPEGNIPPARLREEADKRRAAEAREQELLNRLSVLEQRMLAQAQPQPKQQPQPERKRPDPLLDPEGAEAFDNEVRAQERKELDFNLSCRFARLEHKEVFDEAFKSISAAINGGNTALKAQLQNSSDPGADIVRWYQQRKVFSEVGPDPLAYKQKLREELLKDPEFIAKAIETAKQQALGSNGNRTNTVTSLPPSLQKVSGGASKNSGSDGNSDADVFQQAFG